MLPLNRKRESQNHVTGQRLVASSGYAVFLTCQAEIPASLVEALPRAEGVPGQVSIHFGRSQSARNSTS